MNKKRIVIGAVIAAMAVVCVACVSYCQAAEPDENGNRPLFDVLRDNGFEGSEDDWLGELSGEQKAAIDIAYEASVDSGYQGSYNDWLAREVRARTDNNGDLVVVLPDGAEVTVPMRPGAAGGFSQANADSNSSQPNVASGAGAGSNQAEQSGSESGASSSGASASDSNSSSFENADSAEAKSDEQESSQAKEAITDSGLIVDNVQAKPGDHNVVVPVRIQGNPGVLGLTFTLSYDEAVLTLKSAENGSAFDGVLSLTHSRSLGSGCVFTWDGVDVTSSDIKDGAVLNLYFDIADNAALGLYPLVIRGGDSAITNDMGEVALAVENGSIKVQ